MKAVIGTSEKRSGRTEGGGIPSLGLSHSPRSLVSLLLFSLQFWRKKFLEGKSVNDRFRSKADTHICTSVYTSAWEAALKFIVVFSYRIFQSVYANLTIARFPDYLIFSETLLYWVNAVTNWLHLLDKEKADSSVII